MTRARRPLRIAGAHGAPGLLLALFLGGAALAAHAITSGAATAASGAKAAPARPRSGGTATQPSPARAAAPRAAGAHPDFSGTWMLDTLRSQFGNIPGGRPRMRTDVIEHRGARVRQTLYMDNVVRLDTTRYDYAVGAGPTVNEIDGRAISTVTTWEPSGLHLVSVTHLMLVEMTLDEHWSLSADRRTLTMVRTVRYPLGEGHQTLRFRRR